MTETPTMIESYLHKIIDEDHPLFTATSDEEMIADHNEEPFYSDYQRTFLHQNGKKFQMKWRVYDGDLPETAKTVFEPAVQV
jgi:hypothetical protein